MYPDFLGQENYYHWFVPGFAAIAADLTDLLKGGGRGQKPISLTGFASDAFHKVKEA